MGFSLIGPGNFTEPGNGIYMDGRENVEVRNGVVRGFGDNGILEDSYDYGKNHRIIGVRANGNGYYGIALKGVCHLVKDCTVSENMMSGLFAYRGSTITGNTAYNNQYSGIYANGGNTVTGNTAYNNQKDGIEVAFGCTVAENTACFNQQNGIYLSADCLVHGNTATINNQSGGAYTDISCFQGNCTLVDNHVTTPTS
jgi:parallel beta-helix repeat protein